MTSRFSKFANLGWPAGFAGYALSIVLVLISIENRVFFHSISFYSASFLFVLSIHEFLLSISRSAPTFYRSDEYCKRFGVCIALSLFTFLSLVAVVSVWFSILLGVISCTLLDSAIDKSFTSESDKRAASLVNATFATATLLLAFVVFSYWCMSLIDKAIFNSDVPLDVPGILFDEPSLERLDEEKTSR